MDGKAERLTSAISVNLTKPGSKKFEIEAASIFPTDHMRRIIQAARAGKTTLELPVFDGSETGEKVYDTLSVIGQADRAGATSPTTRRAATRRWPS